MFDTREYEWADVSVMLGGVLLTKIQGVSYTASQEKEVIYGKGNEPISVQKGNKSYSGSLTLLQSELDSLTLAGGDDGVLGLQVDILVVYGNPQKGDVLRKYYLRGVQFTSEPRDIKSGDKNMAAQSLDFIFLKKLSEKI